MSAKGFSPRPSSLHYGNPRKLEPGMRGVQNCRAVSDVRCEDHERRR